MGQIADELKHHLLIGEIQRGARLIKQQRLTLRHQRPGYHHQLLLPPESELNEWEASWAIFNCSSAWVALS